MASIENSLKYESEVEPGKVRLITSGEFVRAYNHSAWLFYCCISKYKVIRKFSKTQQKDVYFLGFPVIKLLELSNGRVCVVDAYKGVEFLGAYAKPYRTYPSRRSLRRMRGRMKSLDWSEGPRRVQARVNSMLGVLSHYDCWHMRRLLVWDARLREFGKVTDDCLRFCPDELKFMFHFKVNGGTR